MSTILPIREVDDREDLSTALDGPATLSNPHGDYLACVVDGATRWLVVDHRCTFIDDEDAGAIYETNLAAARDALGVDAFNTVTIGRSRYWAIPLVDEDDAETLADLCQALADYPLLDENAYYQRDHEAWQECWSEWAADEVRRAAVAQLVAHGADEETASDLLAGIEFGTFSAWAHGGMGWYYGLRGEYDEDGAVTGVLEGIAHHYRDPADDHALVKFFPGTPGVTPPRWITYRDEGGIFVPVTVTR